jgi:hypothetical protein
MVERFVAEAADAQKREQDPAIKRELESLVSSLSYLRLRSIKSGIRRLIEETLRSDPDIPAPADVAKEVSRLYDLRSTLVHSGEADHAAIREASNRLNDLVPRILRILFKRVARRE